MAIPLTELVDKIFKVAKLGKLPSFILAFIAWGFLLIPKKVTEYIGIHDLIDKYKHIFGFLAIFFSFYFLAFSIYEFGRKRFTARKQISIIKKRLKNLSEDEKKALKKYIDRKVRTASFSLSGGVGEGLQAKGILYRSSSLSCPLSIDEFSYNIQDVAYDYLMKNKKLLEEEPVETEI